MSDNAQPIRFLMSIPEAAQALGLGRTMIFQLIKEGKLRPKKFGRRTCLSIAEVQSLAEHQAQ